MFHNTWDIAAKKNQPSFEFQNQGTKICIVNFWQLKIKNPMRAVIKTTYFLIPNNFTGQLFSNNYTYLQDNKYNQGDIDISVGSIPVL